MNRLALVGLGAATVLVLCGCEEDWMVQIDTDGPWRLSHLGRVVEGVGRRTVDVVEYSEECVIVVATGPYPLRARYIEAVSGLPGDWVVHERDEPGAAVCEIWGTYDSKP